MDLVPTQHQLPWFGKPRLSVKLWGLMWFCSKINF